MFFQIWIWPSKSRIRIFTEKLRDKGVRDRIPHMLREGKRIFQYFLINFIWIFSILTKGHITSHKLIQHNPKRPKINRIIIPLPWQYFRCHIIRRPNNRKCFPWHFGIDFLTCSHIYQFKISILTYHNIFRFKIPVHYWVCM